MSPNQEIIIGIDLGTTYSCAAYVDGGKAKIVPSAKGYATVPSVVSLSKKGEVLVGHPALDRMLSEPENTIYGSKRLIGRGYNSMVVQRMRQFMVYTIVEGPQKEAAVMLGGKVYSLQQIAALILAEIKDQAQGLFEREVKRAVITVPAYYNDNQRQAVKEAGKIAGLEVDRIVNEPTAAAIAYGYKKGFDQKVLVYDLGGGTFDVSVLHVHGNNFDVLATGGDTFLGGVDFDDRITAWVINKFLEASGKDLRDEKVAIQRIRNAAEHSKRILSSEVSNIIELPFITEMDRQPIDLKLKIEREQLNKLTGDLVERTLEICDEVLSSQNLKPSDIDEILLVGGQTRMPLVQGKIHQHFLKPPRKGVHPDEVVALGAALLGNAELEHVDVKLRDVLSIPIGISLSTGRFKVILDKNTPLPATKAFKIAIDRKGLDIDIYQGEEDQVHENEYLGTFQFPAQKKLGSKKIPLELRFSLTEESILMVTAIEPASGKQASIKMVTLHTPDSLRESMSAALAEVEPQEAGWFQSFANRILGGKN